MDLTKSLQEFPQPPSLAFLRSIIAGPAAQHPIPTLKHLNSIVRRISNRLKQSMYNRHDRLIKLTIDQFAVQHRDVVLVQIGSNDGKTNDPFYSHLLANQWSALLVEPVPYIFNRLTDTHRNSPGVRLENVAVSQTRQQKTFYFLKHSNNPDLPWWYDQIGSFDKEQVMKSATQIEEFNDLFTSAEVSCVPLPELLETNNIETIDIFHTDVEGYDFAVLKQLDLKKWRPKLILYEHKHLSKTDQQTCSHRLRKNGYRLIVGPADTLAVAGKHSPA